MIGNICETGYYANIAIVKLIQNYCNASKLVKSGNGQHFNLTADNLW